MLGRSCDLLVSEKPLEQLRFESGEISMLVHLLGELELGENGVRKTVRRLL